MSAAYRRCRIYVRRSFRRFDWDEFMFYLYPILIVYLLGWIMFGPVSG